MARVKINMPGNDPGARSIIVNDTDLTGCVVSMDLSIDPTQHPEVGLKLFATDVKFEGDANIVINGIEIPQELCEKIADALRYASASEQQKDST